MLILERVKYRCRRDDVEREEDESWPREDLCSLCHDSSFVFTFFFSVGFHILVIDRKLRGLSTMRVIEGRLVS